VYIYNIQIIIIQICIRYYSRFMRNTFVRRLNIVVVVIVARMYLSYILCICVSTVDNKEKITFYKKNSATLLAKLQLPVFTASCKVKNMIEYNLCFIIYYNAVSRSCASCYYYLYIY
jgi:hypothetical protein